MQIDWKNGLDYGAWIAPLIPVVVALIKRWTERMPKYMIPVLATFLGIIGQALVAFSTNTEIAPIYGSLLGMLGIGIREIVTQLTKKVDTKLDEAIERGDSQL